MSAGHVAHLNWGILRGDWDDPVVAGFVDAAPTVNRLAVNSPGFVWRYGADGPEDFSVLSDDPRLAATLSVWTDAAALRSFVTRTLHGAFLARRAEWFVPQAGPTYVVWPIAAGHRPGPDEACAQLRRLAAQGPSAEAYDFAWLRTKAH